MPLDETKGTGVDASFDRPLRNSEGTEEMRHRSPVPLSRSSFSQKVDFSFLSCSCREAGIVGRGQLFEDVLVVEHATGGMPPNLPRLFFMRGTTFTPRIDQIVVKNSSTRWKLSRAW